MNHRTVIVGSDHAGFPLKEAIKQHLEGEGIQVVDVGARDETSSDHPVFAKLVARKVLENPQNLRGILVCGTGIGMCITANKIHGIRAALVTTELMAQVAREHNDANILCLGGRVIDKKTGIHLTDIFLKTPFLGEEVPRYQKRVDMYESC